MAERVEGLVSQEQAAWVSHYEEPSKQTGRAVERIGPEGFHQLPARGHRRTRRPLVRHDGGPLWTANVFVDVDLAPGVDFVQRISEAVGECRVLLVIIGPRWASLTDDEGATRIADPDDFVRLEVETALRRAEVTVIPVLVAGAQIPDPDDLPEGVRPLTRAMRSMATCAGATTSGA